jgi:hypothetical protein
MPQLPENWQAAGQTVPNQSGVGCPAKGAGLAAHGMISRMPRSGDVLLGRVLNNTVWQKVGRFECFQCQQDARIQKLCLREFTEPKSEEDACLKIGANERGGIKVW